MSTLDTLFIQKSNRGQGWGHSAVKDVILEFPHENIGFSFPISIPMSKGKFLVVTSTLHNLEKKKCCLNGITALPKLYLL
jgi:hypothetical protein